MHKDITHFMFQYSIQEVVGTTLTPTSLNMLQLVWQTWHKL